MALSSLYFIIGQRVWQGIAGLITVVFIATFLSAEQQGWYYTFISLAALYSLFEMGLATTIVQICAHFFADLRWLKYGQVEGAKISEFNAFFVKAVRIYLGFSGFFFFSIVFLGWFIFSNTSTLEMSRVDWLGPWFAIVLMTALSMITLPFLAVLEGSGQMCEVYGLRLVQGISGAVACWLVLLLGGSLWAAAMMPAFSAIIGILFLYFKYPYLGRLAIKVVNTENFNWRLEALPLQWRVGLAWISIFMMSQLATPILFIQQNAVIAGQIGLSLALVHMVGIVSQSWLVRQVPAMSLAVAREQWHLLDSIFKRDFALSLATFAVGSMGLVSAYVIIQKTPFGDRLLPFLDFAQLLLFVLFYFVNNALATQLRLFKKEPLVWVFLFGAAIIVLGSWHVASTYSVSGVILVMLMTQAFIVFPMSIVIWRHRNRQWRNQLR